MSKMRNFQADDFARFHPGGALGRKLSKVDDIMRPLAECRSASDSLSVREVIVKCTKPGRRSGAIMLTDKAGRLTGLFTDSDLARLFEKRDESALDRPMCTVMVRPADDRAERHARGRRRRAARPAEIQRAAGGGQKGPAGWPGRRDRCAGPQDRSRGRGVARLATTKKAALVECNATQAE